MSDFDFIVDNIRFSYSSTTTFETCPYSFKLSYIDKKPRRNNFYSDFGLLVHECYEQYFNGNLDSFELSSFYEENFDVFVKTDPPVFPLGMWDRYKEEGRKYFDTFSFPINDYNIIAVEDTIDFELNGVEFTARPDLVLQEKESGVYVLVDYKTSAPFRTNKKTGKETTDSKKIEGYEKQLYTYAHALREYRNYPIEKMTILFPRLSRQVDFEWNKEREKEVLDWLSAIIEKIKKENDFSYDNTNPYFCNNLCGVREFCEYRKA